MLRSKFVRSLLEEAARRINARVRFGELGLRPRARGSRSLIVHDFQPDPAASLSWLEEAAGTPAAPTVFALLESPASSTLESLVRSQHHFRISGMAIASEDGPSVVAERLENALWFGSHAGLVGLVRAAWRLDETLADLVDLELTGTRPHATLAGLLRDAGMSRKRFVPRARHAGFEPPARFFQSLRVLRAGTLLDEALTVAEIREALGYGSPATLQRHFHRLLGMSADQARTLTVEEMVGRLTPGSSTASDLIGPRYQ